MGDSMRTFVFALTISAVLFLTVGAEAAGFGVPVIISPAFRAPIHINPPKFVAAGGHVILWETAALNPDCSSNGPVTFRILKTPQHGRISIISTGVFPQYPPANVRSICNARRVPGQRMTYFAQAGYSGTDAVDIETIFPAGTAELAHIGIVVR